ncbi:hypothetical protein B0J14DRAFT_3467 [Halenospora varia]|nr:hypothetical protein B0J14DRAFT_3467 [Halenospora varia]
MHFFKAVGGLALASVAVAQNQTYCPASGICFAVNVPASSSSGSGDIYFQMQGPTSLSWISLGQGSSMKGSNIFFAYANSAGTNVTLSPRLGVGDKQPSTGATTSLTLLSGSGISNGIMTANVKCSNCNSWSGGSMSFTSSSSNWIWAYKTGSAVSSDSVTANLAQHNKYGSTTFNLQSATGGSSSNPFLASAASSTPSPSSSKSGDDDGNEGSTTGGSSSGSSGGGRPSTFSAVREAHGILASVAFVLMFPMGAIAIRAFSFPGLLWLHGGWMVFTYVAFLTALGMGVWIAVMTEQLGEAHSIIGIFVGAALLLQPLTGVVHHLLYKRTSGPNVATYPHVWWGRAIITLGIINGGLGLQLSANATKGQNTAYAVVAAIMWLLWMAAIVVGICKSRRKSENVTREIYSLKQSKAPGHSSAENMRESDSLRINQDARPSTQNSYPDQHMTGVAGTRWA